MRTVAFLNVKARKGQARLKTIKKFLEKQNDLEIIEVIVVGEDTTFEKGLERLAKHKNIDMVILGGGDGTIVAALNALAGKKILYGLLPLGTSNVFVRSIGLPIQLDKALKVMLQGASTPVSLGEVNGKLFANSAGSGVPVAVVNNLTNTTKRFLGPLAYIASGLREFVFHNAFLCNIKTDKGEKHTFYTHHLLIANGEFHGLVPVGQGASVRNDQLTIFAFGTTKNRWDYAKSIIKFGLGKNKVAKTTTVISAHSFTLNCDPIKEIEADGEPIGRTPAKIKAIKNAINVRC